MPWARRRQRPEDVAVADSGARRLPRACGSDSREDSVAEGGRWLDRLNCEGERGSSLGEPDRVCPTLLAASDVQLEPTALIAA